MTEVTAKIGMLVAFTQDDHLRIPRGTTGVIDAVDPVTNRFWVLVDNGGFFGWTSFSSWEWSGSVLPRNEETEGWYALRESEAL